jgi:serine palmitoyltransferase
VDEWTPEPLGAPLTAEEQTDLATVPVVSGPNGPRPKLVNTGKQVLNLASYNFTGLAGNETIKERAIETLRKYGVGSCGPPGFYGTFGMPMPSRCSRPRHLNGHLQTCTWTSSAT